VAGGSGSLNSPGDGTATGMLKGHRVAGHLVDLDYPVLINLSRRDSATTGLGNSGYQPAGDRFEVRSVSGHAH
jgi:hypothetical protein